MGLLIGHPTPALYPYWVAAAEVVLHLRTVTAALIVATLEVAVLVEDNLCVTDMKGVISMYDDLTVCCWHWKLSLYMEKWLTVLGWFSQDWTFLDFFFATPTRQHKLTISFLRSHKPLHFTYTQIDFWTFEGYRVCPEWFDCFCAALCQRTTLSYQRTYTHDHMWIIGVAVTV